MTAAEQLVDEPTLTVTVRPTGQGQMPQHVVIDGTALTIDEIAVMVSIDGHTVDLSVADARRLYGLLRSAFRLEVVR